MTHSYPGALWQAPARRFRRRVGAPTFGLTIGAGPGDHLLPGQLDDIGAQARRSRHATARLPRNKLQRKSVIILKGFVLMIFPGEP
jgi:hypothetical protein